MRRLVNPFRTNIRIYTCSAVSLLLVFLFSTGGSQLAAQTPLQLSGPIFNLLYKDPFLPGDSDFMAVRDYYHSSWYELYRIFIDPLTPSVWNEDEQSLNAPPDDNVFFRPEQVSVDNEGFIIFGDQSDNRLFINYRLLGGKEIPLPKQIEMKGPVLIYQDRIYLADNQRGGIAILNLDGQLINYIIGGLESPGSISGAFISADDLKVNHQGQIAVLDSFQAKIFIYTAAGELYSEINFPQIYRLHYPESLAFFSNGNFVLADTGNNRLLLFSSQGKLIKTLPTPGEGLSRPTGLTIDQFHQLFVCDTLGNRIIRYNPELTKYTIISNSKIAGPVSTAVTSRGELIIASLFSKTVLIFSSDWFGLGRQALSAGEHKTALRRFRQAVKVNPDNLNSRYYISLLSVLFNDINSAAVELNHILKSSLSSGELRNRSFYLINYLSQYDPELFSEGMINDSQMLPHRRR